MNNDFDLPESFLSKITEKDKELSENIKSGKVVCNMDSPEECENCGS